MISRRYTRLLAFGLVLFAMALSLFGWILPVQAAGPALQVTQTPAATTMIPNTGANPAANTGLGLAWIVWVILGIAIIALIVALATRGSSSTDI